MTGREKARRFTKKLFVFAAAIFGYQSHAQISVAFSGFLSGSLMQLSNQPPASDSTRSARCTIIIPVFCGGEHFAACLASVTAALRPGDELIVVANGEGDGSWRGAQSGPARILHCAKNVGPASARNLAASTAQTELLVFIDADVTVRPDCLEHIAAHFAANHGLSALIGSYDEAPGEQNFLSQFKNLFHHYVHQHGHSEASTFWGACGAIRRETFLELGGFDEEYSRPSIEDIELGYRLRAAGHRIGLVHELQVKHWKKWEAWKLIKSDLVDRAAPWTHLVLRRWREGKRVVVNDLNLGRVYRLSLVTSYLLAATLVAALFVSGAWLVALPLALLFLYLNWPLFRFFRQKRGWRFTCAAIGWRFVYDLCSGLGALVGLAQFVAAQLRVPEPKHTRTPAAIPKSVHLS